MADNKNGAPEGFDTQVGRERGDGWLKKVPGTTIHGRLVGRFTMKQRDDSGDFRVFYQVKLGEFAGIQGKDGKLTPIRANQKEDNVKEEVDLVVGQLVNIDEHAALENLAPYTQNGGVYDVWFRYVSQDPIPGSNKTFWKVEGPKLKTIKPGRQVQQGVEGEKIPF